MNQKKDQRAQVRGLLNRARGKRFEDRLSQSFEYYRKSGEMLVDKTPEPVKVIAWLDRKKGFFKACFEKKAQPDFKGVVRGGTAVFYEAKYTNTDRIAKSRVSETQTAYMNDATALGARCFVIAGFSSGSVYVLPWCVWRLMKNNFGREYVTERDIESYKVRQLPNGAPELFFDKI